MNEEYNYNEIPQTPPIGGTEPNLPFDPAEIANTPNSNIVPGPNGSVMSGGALYSPNYSQGIAGWIIKANGDVEFNNGVFRGAISASTIDIGGSDSTSFHVDASGNMWLGAATFASAPFRVNNDGSGFTAGNVTFTSMAVNEIAIDGTPNTNLTSSGPYTGGSSNTGFNAGGSISAMDLIYLDSSSTWQQTDADAVGTTAGFLGISKGAYTVGQQIISILPGSFVRNDAWNWTPGATLYASTTPGEMTATAPSGSADAVRKIGYAVTADVIYFNPSSEHTVIP